MAAPTEAEIRQVIHDRAAKFPGDNPRDKLDEGIDKALDALGYVELDDDEQDGMPSGATVISDLWTDLRPSEAVRLRDVVHDVRTELRDALWSMIEDRVVAAGLTFAAEHPDAPRARGETVTA